jgi:hypothetical protein
MSFDMRHDDWNGIDEALEEQRDHDILAQQEFEDQQIGAAYDAYLGEYACDVIESAHID